MPVLIHHLLERNARIAARIELTPAAVAALSRCRWPGNVRELSNLLERAVHPASGARGWTSSNCPTVIGPQVGADGPRTAAFDAPRNAACATGGITARRPGSARSLERHRGRNHPAGT